MNDCLSFRRGEFLRIVLKPAGSPLHNWLVIFADTVLVAVPLPDTKTYHLEFWHKPDNEVVFCEVAFRTCGLRVSEMLVFVHGFDMDRAWFSTQVGLLVKAPTGPAANADSPGAGNMGIYPGTRGLAVLSATPLEDGVISQIVLGWIGQIYQRGCKSGIYIAAFVVTGDNDRHVERRFQEVTAWFKAGAGCRYSERVVAS